MAKDKSHLHNQLVRLGDMMGDGMHLEPGGKWISKEYKQIVKALGLSPKRIINQEEINKRMAERVKDFPCPECKGELKQTRSGSMRAKCTGCKNKYQLLKKAKK